MEKKEKEESKKQLKTYIAYSGMAIQMGVTIYLGSLLGEWLDEKYPNPEEYFTKGITLLAVFLSMYMVINKVVKNS